MLTFFDDLCGPMVGGAIGSNPRNNNDTMAAMASMTTMMTAEPQMQQQEQPRNSEGRLLTAPVVGAESMMDLVASESQTDDSAGGETEAVSRADTDSLGADDGDANAAAEINADDLDAASDSEAGSTIEVDVGNGGKEGSPRHGRIKGQQQEEQQQQLSGMAETTNQTEANVESRNGDPTSFSDEKHDVDETYDDRGSDVSRASAASSVHEDSVDALAATTTTGTTTPSLATDIGTDSDAAKSAATPEDTAETTDEGVVEEVTDSDAGIESLNSGGVVNAGPDAATDAKAEAAADEEPQSSDLAEEQQSAELDQPEQAEHKIDATQATQATPATKGQLPAKTPSKDAGDGQLSGSNLFTTAFKSPPKFIHHVDAKTKAQGVKAELEALRKRSQVKPQAAKLHNAEAPKEMADFFHKQKEQHQERRQNERAAQALLHSFRANDIVIARKKKRHQLSSSPATVTGGGDDFSESSYSSAPPAYATMAEIDMFFRQQRSMQKSLQKERRKTMESLHNYRPDSQNRSQSSSPDRSRDGKDYLNEDASPLSSSSTALHRNGAGNHDDSNATNGQPIVDDICTDIEAKVAEHGFSSITRPTPTNGSPKSTSASNPPSPDRSMADSIGSLPDISVIHRVLELRLQEALRVPLPESPSPSPQKAVEIAGDAAKSLVKDINLLETEAVEDDKSITHDVDGNGNAADGGDSHDTDNVDVQETDDGNDVECVLDNKLPEESVKTPSKADPRPEPNDEIPFVISRPAEDIDASHDDLENDLDFLLCGDVVDAEHPFPSSATPTSHAKSMSMSASISVVSSPSTTHSSSPQASSKATSSSRRPSPARSISSASPSLDPNSSTSRRLKYDQMRRGQQQRSPYTTPSKTQPPGVSPSDSPESLDSTQYLFGSIKRKNKTRSRIDKNRRQTIGVPGGLTSPLATSSPASLASVRYINGRIVEASPPPKKKAPDQRHEKSPKGISTRKKRVSAPIARSEKRDQVRTRRNRRSEPVVKPKPKPLKTVPLYVRRPSQQPKKGPICHFKFTPSLHGSRGACERCWYWASQDEKDRFLKEGHHLRIMKVRGGCCRQCTIFPRKQDENPVRLCRRCFHDTHKEEPPLDEWDRHKPSPRANTMQAK